MTSRRLPRAGCLITLFCGCLQAAQGVQKTPADWVVYIGTYTDQKSRGIYVSRFNSVSGILSQPSLAAEMRNPSFLAVHPKGKALYAVSEVENFGERRQGSVGAYAIEKQTGKLRLLNETGSGGSGPCHLAVEQKGKCVLVANYGSGSLAALAIAKSGHLKEVRSLIQHQGSSVNRDRQAGPHAHQVVLDRANRFALACDLGLDKVLVYRPDWRKPGLVPNMPYAIRTEPGAGPRHLDFNPTGTHVYLVNEMGCSVDTYAYEPRKGTLQHLQTSPTLPAGFKGDSTCAEIQVHPSGRFLYASNRGHDSIAAFSIDQESGQITPIGHFPSGGRTPRHFAVDPSGRWLLAENQNSDNIMVFEIDSRDGKLTSRGPPVEVGNPVCLVFANVR